VLHVNCRSVLPKLTEIKNLILRLPVSVLALSETWLADSLEDLVDLSGYQFIHRARQNGQGGGVGLLIQEDISFQIYDLSEHTFAHTSYEGIFVRILHKSGSFLMGVIYRPPGLNLDLFNTEIESLLSAVSRKNKEVVLVGDFNKDLLKIDEHKASNTFYNCLISHHFLPAITRPTRVTPHSSPLIDN